ncbi:PEGA domain-containing protein [Biformimicrobium ophioploci]|uniref:PEGA domain-containing protein n=1 Tax=Biformimicrobium ophioploci TaxID=3036711 RepID=A0ABQ6LYK8_9GAMM|nr:PEGA domain-containing protein [Microbulbifer sp. NKW57]GMG87175.1 PEGA domain-containing protein [Microbulbifer sp. NKW57]
MASKSDKEINTHTNPADADPAVVQVLDFNPASGDVKRKGFRLSGKTVSASLLMLVALAALTYLVSARSLIFDTDPENADIQLSGLHFRLGEGFLLMPGDYQYRIVADGYLDSEGTVSVTSDNHTRHAVEMQKKPGHLNVVTEPGTTVEVLIDGEPAGTAPGVIRNIAHGVHTVTLRNERYLDHIVEVDVTGLDQVQDLTAKLEPAWANVALDTVPSGATVTVDDRVIGTTPLDAELIQGKRKLTFTLPDRKPTELELDIVAGIAQAPAPVTLPLADGTLYVRSTPSGASITLNGEYLGKTPATLDLAPGQKHKLQFFKDGYKRVQETVEVGTGAVDNLAVNLKALFGQVRVSAKPADAKLFVDGKPVGFANQTLKLPARPHKISVRKAGYETYETAVIPSADLDQRIDTKLMTVEQARWSRVPPTIETRAGGKLKLFRPQAEFTMGASRREQGRRANEALRNIALDRPFYIGVTEVTNREFRRFKRMHTSSHIQGVSLDNDPYPVVRISWNDAALYCNWLSEQEGLQPVYKVEKDKVVGFDAKANGYRMPTEAEWAWAARFAGEKQRKFPWGDDLPIVEQAGNFADLSAANIVPAILQNYRDNFPATAPVGSFRPNPVGLYDLGGNVSEWIHDLYSIGTGLSTKRERNPVGPGDGDYHVIRDASWRHASVTELRLSYRDYGADGREDVGFRLARWVDQE